jgi:hypothetical protein
MWSTEYSADTELAPKTVWAALRGWMTGAIPIASGDHRELRGEFVEGATIASTPEGLDIVLDTAIVTIVENEVFEAETPFNGLKLLDHYDLQQLVGGGTRVTHKLGIDGDADAAAIAGPRISADFPEAMEDLLTVALKGGPESFV